MCRSLELSLVLVMGVNSRRQEILGIQYRSRPFYTDKKENKIFLVYKKMQKESGAKVI